MKINHLGKHTPGKAILSKAILHKTMLRKTILRRMLLRNLSVRKTILQLIVALSAALVYTGCANQLPPPGGEIDTIPPEIVASYPENGTVSFRDDHIELEFSEYVDKRSLQDAIFISPAPEGTPEYDWSGHSVRIKFENKLQPDITYVVTIGTEVTDINQRNNMAQAFNLTFSTGENIDRGIISGRVYADKPQGVMLFAYDLKNGDVNPALQKPKYITQSGKDGRYSLAGIANSSYRVFAVRDEYRDFLYNKGSDEIGVPFMDIPRVAADTSVLGMDFFMASEDSVAPRLIRAAMTDRKHVLLEFSEEVDSLLIRPGNFSLIDSTELRTISPVYAYKGRTKKTEMVLVVNDSIPEADNVFVTGRNIKDKIGNVTEYDFTQLVVSARVDTSAPVLYSTTTSVREEQTDLQGMQVNLFFDDAFDSSVVKSALSIVDRQGRVVSSGLSFFDDASFTVNITQQLRPKTEYTLRLQLKNIKDAAGNYTDSLFTYKFTTTMGTGFSGVSGNVDLAEVGSAEQQKVVVVLKGTDGPKKSYKKKAEGNGKFNFDRVEPGRYVMWSFIDGDNNGSYSYGRPHPFKPSERFTFYSDTLNLRARWPLSDALIKYGKK